MTMRQAARCGIPYATVVAHCRGTRGMTVKTAKRYAYLLDIPLAELVAAESAGEETPSGLPVDGREGASVVAAAGLPSVCPAAGDVSASKSAAGGEGGGGDRAAGAGSPAGATRRRRAACTITRP